MVSDEETVEKVTSALCGELYVGRRVRVSGAWNNRSWQGAEAQVVEIFPERNQVKIYPPVNNDGVWHKDWIKPV